MATENFFNESEICYDIYESHLKHVSKFHQPEVYTMARHSDHCNTPLRTVANAAGEVTISIITSSIFSIFSALTFLAAALTFSVNLINITQENAQNNENTNNNMNMNMNMNTNTNSKKKKKKRSLKSAYAGMQNIIPYHWKKPLDNILDLVELPKGLERLVNSIKSQPYNKSHHHVKINRTQLKNIHTFGRGSISSSIESRFTNTTMKPPVQTPIQSPSTFIFQGNPVFSSMNASAHHFLQLFSSPIKRVQNMTSEILENGLEQLKNITLVPIQEQLDTFSNQTANVLTELQPKQVLNRLNIFMKPSMDILNTVMKTLTNHFEWKLESFHNFTDELIIEPIDKMKTDMESFQNLLQKLKPEHVDMALKALPILIPYVIDHHTPKLHQILKPGTKFTVEELFKIHQSLKEFHQIVKDFQDDKDVKQSQNLLDLTNFVLSKNTKLMGHVFVLMVRAKRNSEKMIELSKSDLDTLEEYLISPKEMYLKIVNKT